jgi:hypothetical protein
LEFSLRIRTKRCERKKGNDSTKKHRSRIEREREREREFDGMNGGKDERMNWFQKCRKDERMKGIK